MKAYTMFNTLGILGLPSGYEWIVLVIIGLLLFGRKLPTIARSLGQSVVEFKKGIKGVKDDVETASNAKSEPDKVNNQSSDQSSNVIDVEGKPKANSEA